MRKLCCFLVLCFMLLGFSDSYAPPFRFPFWPAELPAVYVDTLAVLEPWYCATHGAYRCSKYVPGIDSTWAATGFVVPPRSYIVDSVWTWVDVVGHPDNVLAATVSGASDVAIECRLDSVTVVWSASMNQNPTGLVVGFIAIKPTLLEAPSVGVFK